MTDITKLAQQISHTSVEFVFGIPGSGPSLQLLDALEKLNIHFIRTHIEASAPLMAAGGWIATGKPGVAISIRGPGLTNMLPGIAACHFERLPIVSISEAISASSPPEIAHKRINHEDVLKAVSKSVFYLSDALSFSDILSYASMEMPAPVHLNLCIGKAIEKPNKKHSTIEKMPEVLGGLIRRASKPIVIAGTFANRKKLNNTLKKLAVPVFTTAAAKGAINESLPQSAGVYTGVGLDLCPERTLLEQADLIICIGLVHNEVLSAKKFTVPSINIIHTEHISQCSGFNFEHLLDESLIDEVLDQLSSKAWGLDEVERLHTQLRKVALSEKFSPAHVFDSIENIFDGQVRIALDTGNFCVLGEHLCKVRKSELYLSSGQSRYMGIGIPMSIGAALHDRSLPTITCVGDGSIGMFFSELKIVSEMKLPICIVLMRDAFFGSIRATAINKGLSDKALKINQPSWIKIIEALGIQAIESADQDSIEDALRKWSPSNGPLYIEAIFEPNSYMNSTRNIR